MTPLYLGVLAGICLYAAVHHLQVALHLRYRVPHVLLAVASLAFSVLCLQGIQFYLPRSSVELEAALKSNITVALVGLGALDWFVGARAEVPRKLVVLATATLALAAVADLVAPGTLLFGHADALQTVQLPWGDVYHRLIFRRSAWRTELLVAALVLPLLVLIRAIYAEWQKGDLPEAGILGAVLIAAVAPSFVGVVVWPLGAVPFPVAPTGFTASIVLLSMLASYDVARTTVLEEDLSRSEERFRRLVDTAPQAIAVFDPHSDRCLGVNARAEELLGRTIGNVQGCSLGDFLGIAGPEAEENRTAVRALKERALSGEVPTTEWALSRADGTRVPCDLRITAQEPDTDSLLCVSLLDLTERKQAEQDRIAIESRLRQSERLETLGTLAGGIAHDFNNMLTPILGYGELALDELQDHPARPLVMRMQSAAEHARQLNRHILTFSRQVESPNEIFELQPVVQQSLRFLRATLPARIGLVSELAAPEARIEGNPAEFHQVVMSLGANAAEAMDSEGRIRVNLREEAGFVRLSVSDTGPGIDDEDLPRIFDPFFTTKTKRHSSGLGLSVVHGVVTSVGGSIDVTTAHGEGAEFTVRLPLVVSGRA